MSLATRCPACGTIFRVVQDQLKVSEGWVRCGQCHEVFHGIEALFDLESDPVLAARRAARQVPPAPPPARVFANPRALPESFAPAADPPPAAPPPAPLPAWQDVLRPQLPALPEGAHFPPFGEERAVDAPDPAAAPPAGFTQDHGDEPSNPVAPQTGRPRGTIAPRFAARLAEEAAKVRPQAANGVAPAAPPEPEPEPNPADFAHVVPTPEVVTSFDVPGVDADAPAESPPPQDASAAPPDAFTPTETFVEATPSPFGSEPAAMPSEPPAPPPIEPPPAPEPAPYPLDTASASEPEPEPDQPADGLVFPPPRQPRTIRLAPPPASDAIVTPMLLRADPGATTLPSRLAEEDDDEDERAGPPTLASMLPDDAGDWPPRRKPPKPRLESAERALVVVRDDDPRFLREAQRSARWQRPGVRAALVGALVVLVVAAAGQLAWPQRENLAARWPATLPAWNWLCAQAGCRIEAPRAIASLALDGSSLTRTDVEHVLLFSADLHNRADHPVRMPSFDLTFMDLNGAVVARKVLSPAQIGIAQDALAPDAELHVHARIRVAGLDASGFQAEMFYP